MLGGFNEEGLRESGNVWVIWDRIAGFDGGDRGKLVSWWVGVIQTWVLLINDIDLVIKSVKYFKLESR